MEDIRLLRRQRPLQYLFTDQLGSTSVASNFDDSVIIRQSYYPWGKAPN